jgi:xeroderma pigmentosum group C-complementing protein
VRDPGADLDEGGRPKDTGKGEEEGGEDDEDDEDDNVLELGSPNCEAMPTLATAALRRGLFGDWQTDPFAPPAVEGGVVPKNDRGTYELWCAAMLPAGGAHVDSDDAAGVAARMRVDYARALVGFSRLRNSTGPKWAPKFRGVVVPADAAAAIQKACDDLQEARQARERAALEEEARLDALANARARELARTVYDHASDGKAGAVGDFEEL